MIDSSLKAMWSPDETDRDAGSLVQSEHVNVENDFEGPCASVIIPAHNEEAVIARCLDAILDGVKPGELDVVVACNGCSDRTATIARSYGDCVRVIEIPIASKIAALNAGDQAARLFPRFYIDADVVMPLVSIRQTAQMLRGVQVMAAAPRVYFNLSHCNMFVRAFYGVWTRNPYFDSGKIGSGVYALSKTGHARVEKFPDITADDEFVRRLFQNHERATSVDCSFTVFPPRTLCGVVQIKTRSRRGNQELCRTFPDLPHPDIVRRSAFFLRLAKMPTLWPAIPIYFAVVLATLFRSRITLARSKELWERDSSSRNIC